MDIKSSKAEISGHITVPGSKSHTIRALILASLAEGVSIIHNPLPSADCKSAANAIEKLGAKVEFFDDYWKVYGAGSKIHLPSDVIDVGNSGSTLYFLAPVAATFAGWSIFTGDESIRTRPVNHLVDALNQLGGTACTTAEKSDTPPMLIKGPIKATTIKTDGKLSQYISGIMMAATLMNGKTEINLTDPKEVPYLTMTKLWLESLGVPVQMTSDFKHISVTGPVALKAFEKTVPSDWEAVAFPLVAAIISNGHIFIDNVDVSGSQGDDKIVEVLQSVGADIKLNGTTLEVAGGKVLSTSNLPNKELHVNLSGWPDAVCAMAVAACFIDGTTVLEDLGVCRRKETDRLKVMTSELKKLGADITECTDSLIIHGSKIEQSSLHGATVESFADHRVAMSLACLGLGLPQNETVIVKGAECCNVSFPGFFEKMNEIKANFIKH